MIALIDYGAGNLRSVENALSRLGARSQIATRPFDLQGADAIIFPGVGAAGPAMAELRRRGLDVALREAIADGLPYLGICLGLQLLFELSAEDQTPCLGVLEGTVELLQGPCKVPHVGWNTVFGVSAHPVLAGLEGEALYFVHSYVARPARPELAAGLTDYCGTFASVVARGSLLGVQFHPERSGAAGLALLGRFLAFAAGAGSAAEARHRLS